MSKVKVRVYNRKPQIFARGKNRLYFRAAADDNPSGTDELENLVGDISEFYQTRFNANAKHWKKGNVVYIKHPEQGEIGNVRIQAVGAERLVENHGYDFECSLGIRWAERYSLVFNCTKEFIQDCFPVEKNQIRHASEDVRNLFMNYIQR